MRLLLFTIALMSFSCNENEHSKKVVKVHKEQESDTNGDNIELDFVSPALLKELKQIIDETIALSKKDFMMNYIYEIKFSQEENKCCVKIIRELYYESDKLQGFFMYKNMAIVFYNPNDKCNYGLVDADKLSKNIPEEFADENSGEAQGNYETSGKVFVIHSKDSLELIYNGIF